VRALPKLAFNVPSVAGKSAAEVEHILGRPDGRSGLSLIGQVRRTYRRGAVEVVFFDDRADWIKLHDTRGLPFSLDALGRLGLPHRKPTYVNRNHVMSWDNISNLREVSLYAGGEGVSYVLICAKTRH
jgi:hypothetical protein